MKTDKETRNPNDPIQNEAKGWLTLSLWWSTKSQPHWDGLEAHVADIPLGPHGAFWPKENEERVLCAAESARLGEGSGSASDGVDVFQ